MTNQRPWTDHVTWVPMRGLEKNNMKRGQIDGHRDSMYFLISRTWQLVVFSTGDRRQIDAVFNRDFWFWAVMTLEHFFVCLWRMRCIYFTWNYYFVQYEFSENFMIVTILGFKCDWDLGEPLQDSFQKIPPCSCLPCRNFNISSHSVLLQELENSTKSCLATPLQEQHKLHSTSLKEVKDFFQKIPPCSCLPCRNFTIFSHSALLQELENSTKSFLAL